MMAAMSNLSSRVVPVALVLLPLCACNRLSPEMTPRVVVDAGRIVKAQVARVDGLGDLSVLTRVAVRRGEPARLLAIGWAGYAVLDAESLAPTQTVKFARVDDVGRMAVRDVDGDGAVEFVRLGEHWIGRTAVFALDGAMRWQDADEVQKRGPNATAVVDFDGDGRCELVSSFNVATAMRVADCDGKTLRELPCAAQTGTLRAVDMDGDGKEELAALDGTALRVLAGDGSERLRIQAEDCGYLSTLDIVRDPTPGADRDVFLLHGSTGLSLWGFDGLRIDVGDAKAARERFANFDGARVRVAMGGAEWDIRAGMVRQQAWPAGFVASRVRLRFFAGELAYEELLRAPGDDEVLRTTALHALASESGRPACVLVGCGADVIRYRAR
jgi:hypothetical protein